MIEAFNKNKNHEDWISKLLMMYYDPMYNYKLSLRKKYITHIGDCQNHMLGLNSEFIT